ncbi:MAG: GNAT family N-acetyltransferase [Deltaproteobacteria bacterium]
METTRYRIVAADLDDPEHATGLVHCLDDYAAGPMGRGQGLSLEVQRAIVPGLREHPERLIRLALHGRQVVGAAVCFIGFSTFSAQPRLNVHDLCVLGAHRGQGVGRGLLESVLEGARAAGCSGVTLEVRGDNEVAQRLYRSLGFSGGSEPMLFWERKLP